MKKTISLIVISIVGVGSVAAHHGLDSYDTTRLLEFTGEVIEFRLMDPHSVLVVETVNSDGTTSIWEVEGGTASGIIDAGLSQEFLRRRPIVHVKGFQTRDGLCAPRCRAAGEDFEFEQD